MALAQIVALLLRLLGVTQTIEAFLAGINLAIRGWETDWRALVKPITDTYSIVNDVAHGNVAIKAAVDSMTGSGAYDLNAILAAIAALPAGSSLPTSGAIASDVWGVIDPNSGGWAIPYGDELYAPFRLGQLALAAGGLPARYSPFFIVSWAPYLVDPPDVPFTAPEPDWDDIRPADELMDWLQRTAPDFSWSMDGMAAHVIGYLSSLDETTAPHFTARLTPAEWKRQFGGRSGLAPIWPGAGGAVDGDPVVVTAPQLVVGPMHGIHVTIDSVRSGTGQDVVGAHSNYKWAGWVAFITDVGEVEQFQYLNFDAADYSPKSMAQASSVLIMLKQASQVTVTPWLLA